jgi:hypothetical protein
MSGEARGTLRRCSPKNEKSENRAHPEVRLPLSFSVWAVYAVFLLLNKIAAANATKAPSIH